MLVLLLCSIILVDSSNAARILGVFPAPSISHQVVFRPITEELAKRGHEVTVITADPAFPKGGGPANLKEIDVHLISYSAWIGQIEAVSKQDEGLISQMSVILNLVTILLTRYFENEEIQNLMKSNKFDLVLVEAATRPFLIFSHIFKAPVIQISSFGATFDNYQALGAPTNPLLYPSMMRRRVNDLSMWEKISETYQHYSLDVLISKHNEVDNAVLRKYLGDVIPTVNELVDNVDMLFLNMHPLFEGIRPVPPNIIYLGGLHQKPAKELPADLKSYLDSSKNGVIYLSFGTNVRPSLLPTERIQAIIKVFSELPYNVLWKYDEDELPGKSDNIRIGKWFPQADLLRHPKVKLFITQAGLQSTDEAITAGVPLIGVPILGDQWFNSEKYEYHKIGIKLDIETLTYDIFKKAVKTIINDDSYRRNIVRLRELMQDEPMKPLERAIWWTEYVLRHGGAKHFRSPGANISWAQYLELELVLTLLAGLLVCIILLISIVYFVCKRVMRALAPKKFSPKRKTH